MSHFSFFFCICLSAPNIRRSCPCCPRSACSSSTSWFRDAARSSPRSPWRSDSWASTATGQLSAVSCFPGNAPAEPRPSKLCFFFFFFFFLARRNLISFLRNNVQLFPALLPSTPMTGAWFKSQRLNALRCRWVSQVIMCVIWDEHWDHIINWDDELLNTCVCFCCLFFF